MAGRDLFPDEPIGGKDLFPDEPVGQDLFPESPLPGPLSQLTSAIGRVIDETVAGARDTIDATGFGFKADTAKYFSDHGIVGPKPDDTHGARLLKFTNRMLLEGPVAAVDAATAGFEGVLKGFGQVMKEFGASDTAVNQTIRDVNMFVTSKLGEWSTILPRSLVRDRMVQDIPPKNRLE